MPGTKLKRLLDGQRIKYVTMHHSQAFTAQEIAAAAHLPGQELAKTVMVWTDDTLAMVVLPATESLDLESVREAIGADSVRLATEREFSDRFPDCEVGAMPPFGNLYDLETYVSESLTEDEEIAFNAGTHRELIRMPYDDFARLVQPRVIHHATLEI